MQPIIQIRNCRYPEDLEAIRDIFNHEIIHSTSIYEYEPKTAQQIDAWFQTKVTGQWPVRGAYNEHGQLLGYATLAPFRPHAAYRYTAEHSVYVGQQARGRGIGQQLLCDIIEQAIVCDYAVLVGCIDATNLASLALHKKLGFVHCGTVTKVGFKFDRWLDMTLVQKELVSMAGSKNA
jgi:L-amino acid N-acyltransferase YncA